MAGIGVCVIELRPMTTDDLEAVLALERSTYSTPWSEGVFRDELAYPGRVYVVAEVDRELAGYAGFLSVGDEVHVTTVAVDRDRRGERIGTRLLLWLADRARAAEARHLTLEVRPSNRQAQALYRRFGMAPVGVRKNYYGDEDALIMWVNDIHGPEFESRLESIRESL